LFDVFELIRYKQVFVWLELAIVNV